jgi:hypothetical protein
MELAADALGLAIGSVVQPGLKSNPALLAVHRAQNRQFLVKVLLPLDVLQEVAAQWLTKVGPNQPQALSLAIAERAGQAQDLAECCIGRPTLSWDVPVQVCAVQGRLRRVLLDSCHTSQYL